MSTKALKTSKKTILMGILNITPDSFYDGGEYFGDTNKAVKRAEEMLKEGADIIDIGGESTRPGAQSVSEDEELKRVIPVITAIKKKFGEKVMLSIDTNKSAVAKVALKTDCNIVNSMGGFSFDKNLADVVAEQKASIVIYHIKGTPQTMQRRKIVYNDVIGDIKDFFGKQIEFGMKRGIKKSQFIIDPGIGFGKTLEQNLEIIKKLTEFQSFKLPIMVGISRKSHLGAILKTELKLSEVPSPTERLEASLAETAIAVVHGTTMVRTHDVWETKKFLAVIDKIKSL